MTGWVWAHGKPRNGEWWCNYERNKKVTKHYAIKNLSAIQNHLKSHGKTATNTKAADIPDGLYMQYDKEDLSVNISSESISEPANSLDTTSEASTISNSSSALYLSNQFTTSGEHVVDGKYLQECIAKWVACTHQPFTAVMEKSFGEMIRSAHPDAERNTPRSGTTIRAHLNSLFTKNLKIIQRKLTKSRSKINLCFDLWTAAANGDSYLAVSGSWISTSFEFQQVAIALKHVPEEHTGVNLAKVLADVARDFKIEDRMGCFVLDGATNNDTATDFVSASTEHRIFRGSERRLRCIAHIINITLKTLLLEGKVPGTIIDEGDYNQSDNEDSDEEQGSASKDIIEGLQRIIKAIKASTRLSRLFRSLDVPQCPTPPLTLKAGNSTRWSSYSLMIERSVSQKARIDKLVRLHMPSYIRHLPSENGWVDLSNLLAISKPFAAVTKDIQGRKETIEKVIPIFDELLVELNEYSARYNSTSFLYQRIVSCQRKLRRYLNIIERETPLYSLAVILDPRQKLKYFEKTRTAEELERVTAQLFDIWSRHIGAEKNVTDNMRRELKRFLRSDIASETMEPLSWWNENRERFPLLSKLAIDVLSIPATTAEVERIFSGYAR